MGIETLSEKQKEIFDFILSDDYALICDGSVRSGKTVMMSSAFVIWAMEKYERANFAICGKTVQSAERNVITPLLENAGLPYSMSYKVSTHLLTVRCGRRENRFYVFGGKDESSYTLIQGITLAGVMMDEVALMPKSFVEQAMSRCISCAHPKYFFNCNPESPMHWFYLEWVKPVREGVRHLHFNLQDNPILTPEMIARTQALYTGVFYRRYILGEWCVAEGLVYPNFSSEQHVVSSVPHTGADRFYISIDYGTHNPCSMGLWRVNFAEHKAYREKEYYYSSRANSSQQKTDEEYYSVLEELAGSYPISEIVVDPSAASFIETIRRHNRYRVTGAANDVVDGIRVVSTLLASCMIQFHFSCRDSIHEFGLYSWDEKKNEDTVVKEHDHAMDDIRYFCNTILRQQFRWVDWR